MAHPRKRTVLPLLVLCALLAAPAAASVTLESPNLALHPLGVSLTLQEAPDSVHVSVLDLDSGQVLEQAWKVASEGSIALGPYTLPNGRRQLQVQCGDQEPLRASVRVIPGWISVLPPIVAIVLAIVLRQVVLALFVGLAIAAFIAHDFSAGTALLRSVDTYIVGSMADPDNASVLLFTLFLGGMVGVIGRSGGARGIAQSVTRFATTPRRGMLSTWGLGVLIFFDDYANTLLVGPTMRPITDRLRVSREKLSFLVDCTAAPVACVALVSSWIGVEVGYIQSEFRALGLEQDAYLTFLRTLPYCFYPFLMLFFVLLMVWLRRDFGPMRRAELRARETGQVLAEGSTPATDFEDDSLAPPEDKKSHWLHAALPLVAVLTTVLVGLWTTGRASVLDAGDEASLRNVIGSADSYRALLWGAFVGSLVAIALAIGTRVLSVADTMMAWVIGLRSVLFALVILVLAWSLGTLCKGALQTGPYLVSVLGPTLKPELLPMLVFLVAAFTAFSTGSSWGTMGILFPLAIPLAHGLAPDNPVIMLGSIASILSGSVWGDHCSPISDTTILSSLASSCDHIDHVRTQLPYVALVGGVAILFGSLPAGMGWYGPWVGLILAAGILTALVLTLGRKVPESVDRP